MAAIREKAGLTQPQMAKKLGVNKNTLGSYERGNTIPAREVVVKFGRLTDSDVDELLEVWEASYVPSRIGRPSRLEESKTPMAQQESASAPMAGRSTDVFTLVDLLMLIEDAIDASDAKVSSGKRVFVLGTVLHHALTASATDDDLRRYTEETCRRLAD